MNSAFILKKRCKNIKILILEAKGWKILFHLLFDEISLYFPYFKKLNLDRVGGRTLTIDLKCAKDGQKSKWDIGGQWVSR
jgi:hypothetical protein